MCAACTRHTKMVQNICIIRACLIIRQQYLLCSLYFCPISIDTIKIDGNFALGRHSVFWGRGSAPTTLTRARANCTIALHVTLMSNHWGGRYSRRLVSDAMVGVVNVPSWFMFKDQVDCRIILLKLVEKLYVRRVARHTKMVRNMRTIPACLIIPQ